MGEIAGCGLRTEQRKRNAAGRKWMIKQDADCGRSKESRMLQAANGLNSRMRPVNRAERAECGRPQMDD